MAVHLRSFPLHQRGPQLGTCCLSPVADSLDPSARSNNGETQRESHNGKMRNVTFVVGKWEKRIYITY